MEKKNRLSIHLDHFLRFDLKEKKALHCNFSRKKRGGE
jgi:hypothetical protein